MCGVVVGGEKVRNLIEIKPNFFVFVETKLEPPREGCPLPLVHVKSPNLEM